MSGGGDKERQQFLYTQLLSSVTPEFLLSSWCFRSTETVRLIRDGEIMGHGRIAIPVHTAPELLLAWCFTSTETVRLIRDG